MTDRFFRRLRQRGAVILYALLLAYISSYYCLSRRSLAEPGPLGVEGIVYVRADGEFTSADAARHYLRARVFAPLNWFDHQLFGTPGPVKCILTELA